MPEGLRRLGLAVAASLVALLLVFGVVLSWFLNRDEVRAAVEAQIRAATGFELAVDGDTTVSLFPVTAVTFKQVRLREADAAEPALAVDELTANLRFFPLLMRRFEIADLDLTRPHIFISRGGKGESNWTPLIGRLAAAVKAGTGPQVSFSEIRIRDGELTYRSEPEAALEKLSDIDVSLAWPAISRSFAATGQFDWRGERIDASVNVGDLGAALTGQRSALRVRAGGSLMKAAFDGAMLGGATPATEGTLIADTPSLRSAFRWIGEDIPEGGDGFGRFALKAHTSISSNTIALTNVNVELDGNAAEGVLSYGTEGLRRTLQATLAAEALDLTPYAGTLRLLASGAHDWNRQPFDLHGFSGLDLDMRLSAARVTIGNTKIGRTALGANLRDGAFTLSIGEAQLYGGLARGSLGITRSDKAADVKARMQLVDVDLESCLGELFGFRRIAGRGNLTAALDASGSSPFALMQTLTGDVALRGHDGALTGFNVEQLLRRLERRPLSGAGDFRNGRTPFDQLNAALRVVDGLATIQDMRLEGSGVRLVMTGDASVPAREFDMKGVASLLSSPDASPSFELPFVLQGPWDDPLLFPDSDSLIRRSNAASPLLESLRNRTARDAVKSAIDRLTGKTAAPAPDNAVAPPSSQN